MGYTKICKSESNGVGTRKKRKTRTSVSVFPPHLERLRDIVPQLQVGAPFENTIHVVVFLPRTSYILLGRYFCDAKCNPPNMISQAICTLYTLNSNCQKRQSR